MEGLSILIHYGCTPIVESNKIVGTSDSVDIDVENWQNSLFVPTSLTLLYSQGTRRI